MKMNSFPKPLRAFFAGLLLPISMVIAVLVVWQAVVGAQGVGEAVLAGSLTPIQGIVALGLMASLLSWYAVRAMRGGALAVRFT
ncbi:hypothetical protein D3C71_1802560 [compost metagenome]|uniref:hypothetical protein n=1 Tax=Acidovorax sp. Root267 TaxID=1736505 RepID=UPI000A708403|nr:hypothetical protein [Acidovorax sp. Root267]